MTRHRILFLSLAAVVVGVVVGWAVWLESQKTVITCVNAEKIAPGMSLEVVEAILGGPERDETDGLTERDLSRASQHRESDGNQPPCRWLWWKSEDAEIHVGLDATSAVIYVHVTPIRRQSPIGKFLEGMGW